MLLLGAESSCLSRGGRVAAPAEFGAIDPHAVQDHSQPPGDRDGGAPHAAPLRDPRSPRLQPRPVAALREQRLGGFVQRSEEHTAELQSPMRISYSVFCLKKKT